MIKNIHKIVSCALVIAFIGTTLNIPNVQAGEVVVPVMPRPGTMVNLSPAFTPAYLKGIVIHPDNALQFDFLINKGDGKLNDQEKNLEYTKLVKYFLAALTVPDTDQWVNLSPYEKDRIVKDDFGKTEMGRDLLAQDYLLKQITSSLMYPESGIGKSFWDKVYAKAQEQFGNTNIPVNTFNKVWIVPSQAIVYENGNTAYVGQSHLKVMLEEDYLAINKNIISPLLVGGARGGVRSQERDITPLPNPPHKVGGNHEMASQIIREIILPELEREVNEGKNFAQLRQVFSGMILATWYKKSLKESLLAKVYADKAKVKGVDQNPQNNQQIYQQYLQAFKKGVYNYIKEDTDKYTHQPIPRKYFAGGMRNTFDVEMQVEKVTDPAMVGKVLNDQLDAAAIILDPSKIFSAPFSDNTLYINGSNLPITTQLTPYDTGRIENTYVKDKTQFTILTVAGGALVLNRVDSDQRDVRIKLKLRTNPWFPNANAAIDELIRSKRKVYFAKTDKGYILRTVDERMAAVTNNVRGTSAALISTSQRLYIMGSTFHATTLDSININTIRTYEEKRVPFTISSFEHNLLILENKYNKAKSSFLLDADALTGGHERTIARLMSSGRDVVFVKWDGGYTLQAADNAMAGTDENPLVFKQKANEKESVIEEKLSFIDEINYREKYDPLLAKARKFLNGEISLGEAAQSEPTGDLFADFLNFNYRKSVLVAAWVAANRGLNQEQQISIQIYLEHDANERTFKNALKAFEYSIAKGKDSLQEAEQIIKKDQAMNALVRSAAVALASSLVLTFTSPGVYAQEGNKIETYQELKANTAQQEVRPIRTYQEAFNAVAILQSLFNPSDPKEIVRIIRGKEIMDQVIRPKIEVSVYKSRFRNQGDIKFKDTNETILSYNSIANADNTNKPEIFNTSNGIAIVNDNTVIINVGPKAYRFTREIEGYLVKITIAVEPKALQPEKASISDVGGIDMNAANMDLQIKRDGKGVPLPIALQDMAQLSRIEGFVPRIMGIRPASSLPVFRPSASK